MVFLTLQKKNNVLNDITIIQSNCFGRQIILEMLEVFDENNNSLEYAVERDTVHEQKLWHRHVSAWIMNDKGLILMQKRSLKIIG